MTVFNMTDLHGSLRHLDALRRTIAEADLVVVSGDITNFGDRAEAEAVIEPLSAINPRILAVSGNCDRGGVEAYLEERGMNLNGRLVERDGIAFGGLGGSLPGPGSTPNTLSEEELAAVLGRIPSAAGKPFVIVSHQPPFDTNADLIRSQQHVGSRSVRAFIESARPVLCLSGHIHESVGQGELAGCRVVNPGPFGEGRFALVTIGESLSVELCVR